jgi:hypothetical protein
MGIKKAHGTLSLYMAGEVARRLSENSSLDNSLEEIYGSPANTSPQKNSPRTIHDGQFTAKNSPQRPLSPKQIHRKKSIYRREFTVVLFKVGQFTSNQVHHKKSPQKIIEKVIHRENFLAMIYG